MEITLSIKGQELRVLGKQPNLYHGSIGVLYIKFCDLNFDASLVKTVRFKTKESDWYTADVVDGRVRVPYEVIVVGGFDIAVGGYDTCDGELLRFLPTNSVHIDIMENGYGEPDAPIETEGEPESVVAKLSGEIDKKADLEYVKSLIPTNTVDGEIISLTDCLCNSKVIGCTLYGNSIQYEIPDGSQYAEIYSVGDLVTDINDENYGKYKILIQLTNDNNEMLFSKYIYLDEPLRKTGKFCDYINLTEGKLVRRCRAVELDGTEAWKYIKDNGLEMLYFGIGNQLSISRDAIICTHFPAGYTGAWNTKGAVGHILNSSTNFIQPSFVFEEGTYNIDTWKDFLSIQKQNETPVTIFVPTTDVIELFDDLVEIDIDVDNLTVTTISSIPANIELTYYQDINKKIAQLERLIAKLS
ncbi:MAG: hypothetical protein UIM24_03045 [Clostridia bacterium]|nr:hypothetical protein [Clostridia bacterium]